MSDASRVQETRDRILAFIDAWNRERDPFDQWVRGVTLAYMESRLQLEAAGRLVGATPAEVEAVLKLATMEDEDLELLNEQVPPKTTWFTLAEATGEGVRAALLSLREADGSEAPSRVVDAAIAEVQGPPAEERIAALDADVFGHLAKKAKQYDLLNDRSRNFLVNIAKRKRSGRPPTPRQIAWAHNCINELIEGGALKRPSPDDDEEIVDQVLDAVEGGPSPSDSA
jgi:hypothetical protein